MPIVRTQEEAALQTLFCLNNYPPREMSTCNGNLPNFQHLPSTLYLQTSTNLYSPNSLICFLDESNSHFDDIITILCISAFSRISEQFTAIYPIHLPGEASGQESWREERSLDFYSLDLTRMELPERLHFLLLWNK